MNQERKNPKWWQKVNALIPAIILAVLGWMALQIVEIPGIKASVSITNATVAALRQDLADHNEQSVSLAKRNSIDHHRASGMTPCNGCHCK